MYCSCEVTLRLDFLVVFFVSVTTSIIGAFVFSMSGMSRYSEHLLYFSHIVESNLHVIYYEQIVRPNNQPFCKNHQRTLSKRRMGKKAPPTQEADTRISACHIAPSHNPVIPWVIRIIPIDGTHIPINSHYLIIRMKLPILSLEPSYRLQECLDLH
jgi:hypothetical protein